MLPKTGTRYCVAQDSEVNTIRIVLTASGMGSQLLPSLINNNNNDNNNNNNNNNNNSDSNSDSDSDNFVAKSTLWSEVSVLSIIVTMTWLRFCTPIA